MTLYLVPTPIGNLGDITLRALEVLRSAAHIVAEDTRRTRKLLSHFELDAGRLARLDAHASPDDLARVVSWLQQGEDVALVTDAGSPSVSDPGSALVRAAALASLPVTALPGPSAVTTAVSLSGLVDGPFRFASFLPRSGIQRSETLFEIAQSSYPWVIFESPHRLDATLKELARLTPNRSAVVTRELSKLHEEAVRGTLSELASLERDWLGEITLVLGPNEVSTREQPTQEEVDQRIDEELARGLHTKSVAERVAAWSGQPKREVYVRVLERKR